MMKITYKKIAAKFINGIVVIGLIVPATVSFAQSSAPQATGRPADRPVQGENFCNAIAERLDKIAEDLTGRIGKLQSERDGQISQIEKDRQDRDEKFNSEKNRQDQQFEENIKRLQDRMASSTEKQALLKYREDVRKAIDARRSALETARKDFRDGMDKVKTARKTAVKKALDNFQNSVKAAIAKAKADCIAKVNPKTVQANLRQSLKIARDKFEAERKAIVKLQDGIKPLIDVRKAAFEKAQNDFKTAINKAKSDFKSARGDGGTGSSTASTTQ